MNNVNEKLKIDMRNELCLRHHRVLNSIGFNSLWSASRAITSIIVFRLHHVEDFLGQFLKHFCVVDFW